MASFDNLDLKVSACISQALLERIFSGCSLAVAQGENVLVKNYGTLSWNDSEQVKEDTFFDLASLTKPLATSLAVFALLSQKKISLDDRLGHLLQQEVPKDKEQITLFHLLNHCSGLAAHRHFYKIIEKIPKQQRKEELLRLVLSDPLESSPGKKDIYSDLGFILLGLIIEKQSGLSFEEAVIHYVYEPLNMADKLIFNPLEKGVRHCVATEHCPWRQRVLQGEVDDQNTWIIGGASGQAGLFGRGEDVLNIVRNLTEIASGAKTHPFIDQDLVKKAMSRQGKIKGSSWGLGFDTPSETGSSAGQFISPKSCGHLGFTGTSFWHDFERDITVVLLTNRIHPSVENEKIKAFRPQFHNLVFKTLS